MLTVISPAKTLDYETPALTAEYTQPAHLHQSRQLVKRLREFSGPDLAKLMGVSSSIAELSVERFRRWKTPFKPENAKQALFAFKGEVYIGLNAATMNQKNIRFAQDHLRMLSGLYGVLRPLDLMQPYRLEMGTRLDTDRGHNLYQFWDTRIARALNKEMKATGTDMLINLASREYFKSVNPRSIKGQIITPVFKDYRGGKYQIIGFFAKKARGLMARYIIDNEISQIDEIRQFDREGYTYDPSVSTDLEWIFTRKL